MKVASLILSLLGFIMNFLYAVAYSEVYMFALAAMGAVFLVLMLIDFEKNTKHVWVGVCGLIFTSLLGGIFYLCWKPE